MPIRSTIGLFSFALLASSAVAGVPKFRAQEIDKTLKIGYGVAVADINDDRRPDILVCDKDRVIWFENPTWKLRTVIGAKTKFDNVCIAAADIDGDGKVEIALGGNWMKMNEPAALCWLKRGASLDEEWTLREIPYADPTLHRMRFADLDGDGRVELIVSPLHGLGATAAKNFAEAGPRLGYYTIPKDPAAAWTFHLIDDSKRVMHNFLVGEFFGGKTGLLTASYEGVYHHTTAGGKWTGVRVGEGNQAEPAKSRGASEIKSGRAGDAPFLATIEPFHGREVVVYTGPADANGLMKREVIDDRLKSGHALWCADLDGDGSDEIVMGFRDPYSGTISYGINIYHLESGKWQRSVLDSGGMATEDLLCADLDGDGRQDIVAVGRATKNVRIYWNEKP